MLFLIVSILKPYFKYEQTSMLCIGVFDMPSIFLVSDETDLSFIERVEQAYLNCENISRNASSSFFRSFRHLPE